MTFESSPSHICKYQKCTSWTQILFSAKSFKLLTENEQLSPHHLIYSNHYTSIFVHSTLLNKHTYIHTYVPEMFLLPVNSAVLHMLWRGIKIQRIRQGHFSNSAQSLFCFFLIQAQTEKISPASVTVMTEPALLIKEWVYSRYYSLHKAKAQLKRPSHTFYQPAHPINHYIDHQLLWYLFCSVCLEMCFWDCGCNGATGFPSGLMRTTNCPPVF